MPENPGMSRRKLIGLGAATLAGAALPDALFNLSSAAAAAAGPTEGIGYFARFGVTEKMLRDGLSAALYSAVTLKDGQVEQSNFHNYPLLRMSEMPQVDVHIVPSSANPSGVGEPGVPPIAPAVVNALFAATGKRLRNLPLRTQDLV